MSLLSLVLGLVCALGILMLMALLGLLARIFMTYQQEELESLHDLSIDPDGVEKYLSMADGASIRSWHKGSGPAVVLVHDAGLSSVTMNRMWKSLAGYGFQVITYDHRGHGASTVGTQGLSIREMVKDLEAVLAYHEVENGILVGHALGSFVCQSYLLDAQSRGEKRIRGFLSVAGFGGNLLKGTPVYRFTRQLWRHKWLSPLLRNRIFSYVFAATAFGAEMTSSRLRAFLQILNAKPMKRLAPIYAEVLRKNLYSQLHRLEVPTIITAAEKDDRIPRVHTEALAARIAHAELIWLDEKYGNMLPWECPDKLVDMVRSLDTQTTSMLV
ncbi:MAG: alpha/beta hydrolase [Bacteroidota bacterium]